MPTTLYFSYFHTNNIAMLYLVHKYKKKLESTNMDLTHSKIMIFFWLCVKAVTEPDSAESTEIPDPVRTEPTENGE